MDQKDADADEEMKVDDKEDDEKDEKDDDKKAESKQNDEFTQYNSFWDIIRVLNNPFMVSTWTD